MDHDDWRVTISLPDSAHAERARRSVTGRQVETDIMRRLGHRVAAGAGGSQVFLYAGTESAAQEAERIAREVMAEHHLPASFALHRWHPLEQEWETPDVPMPRTDAERQAEHQQVLEWETAESVATGVDQWEARVTFPSHHEAVALASKLRSQGRVVIRRWRFLVVPASNEDEALELADQIRREAPSDAAVRAERAGLLLPFIPF